MLPFVSRKRYNQTLDQLFDRNRELSQSREEVRLLQRDCDEYRDSYERAKSRCDTLAAQVQRLTALVPQRDQGGRFAKKVAS